MKRHVIAMGPGGRHFSRRKALLLAADISIAVAALILWALLSHVNVSRFLRPETARDCVYLGRAGSHCVKRANSESNRAPPKRDCEFLGRAGEYCAPEVTSP